MRSSINGPLIISGSSAFAPVLANILSAVLANTSWGFKEAAAAGLREGAPHGERSGVEVEVFPLETSCGDGEQVQRLEPVAGFACRLEESARLVGGESIDLLTLRPRSLDGISDIAGDRSIRNRVLQSLVQSGVDVFHSPR